MQVDLAGVPETALWTLYHRALEARRPDAVLADPPAVELVERLDHPFAERFGAGRGFSRWQALRAATFDREVRRFAAASRGGTVVALGDGLETGFWRAGDGLDRLTVDVPEMVALRERALGAVMAELRALRLPRGRGPVHGVLLPPAARVPRLRRPMLSVYAARFTRR